MVLSRKTILACGEKTAQWDELTTVVDILVTKRLREYLTTADGFGTATLLRGCSCLRTIFHISSWRRAGQAIPLQLLLLLGLHFDATNPRDLIFGLLGVAPDVDDGTIPPDYEQSTEEVFIRWTRFLMARDRQATLLHAAGICQTIVLQNIPSWVSDLTIRLDSVDPNITIFGEIGKYTGFRASRESNFALRNHNSNNCITSQGIIIDTIANLAPPCPIIHYYEDFEAQRPDRLQRQYWQDETLSLVIALSPYPTAESIQDVY
jgi:hypothetical protein